MNVTMRADICYIANKSHVHAFLFHMAIYVYYNDEQKSKKNDEEIKNNKSDNEYINHN